MKWKELTPLPVSRTAHTAVLLHGSVYVGGGWEGRNGSDTAQDCYRVDVYNFTTNQWDPSPITTPYCLYAMTVLNDTLTIAGGHDKNEEFTNKVLVLDCRQWKHYNKMPTARVFVTAVGHQSFLITVGGKNQAS